GRRRPGGPRPRGVAPPPGAPELPGPAPARAQPAARSPAGPPRLPEALPADPRGRVPGHGPDPGRDPLLPDGPPRRRARLAPRRSPGWKALRGRGSEAVDLPLPEGRHPDLRAGPGSDPAVRARAEAHDELPLDRATVHVDQRSLPRPLPGRRDARAGGLR